MFEHTVLKNHKITKRFSITHQKEMEYAQELSMVCEDDLAE